MAGLNFLEKLMRAHPMPVLMTSSLTDRGCETTLRALELGAVDFVSKLAEAQARLKRRSGRSEGPAEAQARLKRRSGSRAGPAEARVRPKRRPGRRAG